MSHQKTQRSLIRAEEIAGAILLIRGQKVLLDEDLARLRGVPTKALNQALSRGADRIPGDSMFRLTAAEFDLRSQSVTSRSWGGRRHSPRAFTEQGVAMLSKDGSALLVLSTDSRGTSSMP